MFVTFLCAVFEPAVGSPRTGQRGALSSGPADGHEPPRWAVKNLGTALGFEAGLDFERTELTLKPGDTLFLYSDGVSEAFNPHEECYGGDRLLADAGDCSGQSATAITAHLLEKSARLPVVCPSPTTSPS